LEKILSALATLCIFGLAGVGLIYLAVHKIKPASFKLSATVVRLISFTIEIDRRGQATDTSAVCGDKHDSAT
jgi:hypothetical protein